MSNLTLYHGSKKIISVPDITKGVLYNDFGPGFYCCESPENAGEWACHRGSGGFINRYVIETDGLNILDLSSEHHTLMNWLAVVLENREFRISSANVGRFVNHLKNYFRPDIEGSDIIIGTRCDDSNFSFVRLFLDEKLSYGQLMSLVRNGSAGAQVVIRSERAYDRLRFETCSRADADVYYPKRKKKDYNSRITCIAQMEIGDRDGLFMHQLLREEVRPGDSRL